MASPQLSTSPPDWSPTPEERARMGVLTDAIAANGRTMASLEALQATLIAHLVAVAQAQHEREVAAGGSDAEWAFRSVAEEIAGVLGCSRRIAEARMADAVALVNRYPAVFQRMHDGAVTAAQARVIVEHGDELDDPGARAAYERAVLDRLTEHPLPPGRLGQVAQAVAEALQPELLEDRFDRESEWRRVGFAVQRNGMGWLRAYVPVLQGAAAVERTRELAAAAKTADVDGTDERTGAQRQADVFCDLLLAGAPTAGPAGVPTGLAGIRATVQVSIPAETIVAGTEDGSASGQLVGMESVGPGVGSAPPSDGRDRAAPGNGSASAGETAPVDGTSVDGGASGNGRASDGSATAPVPGRPSPRMRPPASASLCGHGAIPAVQARVLAATAPVWERLFVDADTGALLTADLRFPTAAQRRFLKARDEHCRFPGCRRSIRKRVSDADHTADHALGGSTCVCNLAYLCESHHTLKHHSAWTVVQRPRGVLEWTSPTGRVYTDTPPPVVRFTPSGAPPPF